MSNTTYAELVNVDNVRRTIKRTFENQGSEILAELLQNSQRAQAKHVRVTTGDGYLCYEDDGCGLKPGLDGIHQLLKIAESGFEGNPTIEAQDPMGVGVHALLAHDMVGCVTFASGDLSLTLDTKRWWGDRDYYTTWADRVETLAVPVEGLRVTVQADEFFVMDFARMLGSSERGSDYVNGRFYSSRRPARGYAGILKVTANGKDVDTSLPETAVVVDPFLELEYRGCPVLIGRKAKKRGSCTSPANTVNWYGQQVSLPDPARLGGGGTSGFHIHMTVRDGRPINPMAPTRKGIIEDSAWAEFADWLKDRIFEFTFNEANRRFLDPEWVLDCFRWDKARAQKESPYFVAKPYTDPHDNARANLGCSSRQPDEVGNARIFRYGDQPTLVKRYVLLAEGDESEEPEKMECGVSSFFSEESPAFQASCGDRNRLKIGEVMWKPGPLHETGGHNAIFHGRGEWKIAYEGENAAWTAVERDAMAFDGTCSYDIRDCEDLVVGCEDVEDFCESELPWMAFDYADGGDSSWEEMERDFAEILDDIVRGRYGDAIKPDFTLSDLASKAGTWSGSIVNLAFGKGEDGHRTVTVATDDGSARTLRII